MVFDKSDKNWLKNNFVTKGDLKSFATKIDVKKIVNDIVIDASHAILAGVQAMFDEHNKENKRDFKNLVTKLGTKINNVERHLKDEINGLKADLSSTVPRSEFNQLKTRVNKYHPVS